MNRRTRFVIATVSTLGVAAVAIGAHQIAPQGGRASLDAHRTLGAPKTFKNLTLIPVYDSTAPASDRYKTLDEGLKSKSVKVSESPSGGDVNTLYVTNRGQKPLYLLAGEVVLGGQQDRCIGQDTVIPPGSKRKAISVFCVEHGRWQGQVNFDSSAHALASVDVRDSAQKGVVYSKAGLAGPPATVSGRIDTRRADTFTTSTIDIGKAQQQVWDKVATKNARFKATPESGTYRQVLNMSGGTTAQSVTPYLKALDTALDRDPKLVGVFAAVNGKVVAADIFGEPALFRKLWPKLLRSYASDAAEKAGSGRSAVNVVTAKEASRFFAETAHADGKTSTHLRAGESVLVEGKLATMYRLEAAKGSGGKDGRIVHENLIRK